MTRKVEIDATKEAPEDPSGRKIRISIYDGIIMYFFKSLTPRQLSNATQIISIVSFPCTMFFSYLAWSESRGARIDQLRYFNIEKAPKLTIHRLDKSNISDTIVRYDIKLKNEGIAQAKNIKASIAVATRNSPAMVRIDDVNCLSRSIAKGSIATCAPYDLPKILLDAGYDPNDLAILESDMPQEGGRMFVGEMTVSFSGEFEENYSANFSIYAGMLNN